MFLTRKKLLNIIQKIIKKRILFELKMPYFLESLTKKISFYKTNNLDYLKEFNINKFCAFKGNSCLILYEKEDIYVIVSEWKGFEEFINFFKEKFKNNKDLSARLHIVEYEIKRCLNTLNNNFNKLLTKFPDMIIKNMGIEIDMKINVDKALISEDRIVDIPKEKRLKIDKINIYTDPNGYITSVKINGIHPNADKDGWFCLGYLKYLPLTEESIDLLKSRLEIANLSDCYWKLQL